MYCTECGHRNPDGANYCARCGTKLQTKGDQTTGALRADEVKEAIAAADEVPGAPPPPIPLTDLEPRTALLVVVRGPNEGARFLLDRDVVTVGRHPDSDIFLDDITVSRRHAEFRRDAGKLSVHDVGSLNGTYVNGVRADDEVLGTGDEVQVGKFKLISYLAEAT